MIGKREMQKITITEKLIRNENEAIEAIKANMPTSGYQMLRESLDMAIQALEEIQQYREIGTVEECREAREKQKPKKMRLLNEKDVIKAVDKHTNEDNTLDDDISCILEEVPTAYDVEAVSKELKNEMEFVVNEYPVYGRYIKKNRAIEILHSGVIPQKSQESPDGKRLREREEFFEER
ncbi:MAG: hypothetical protein ACLR3A_05135 [Sellimonas intestinalis]|uniref:hypothetical protein n=1 Tax=Sellimonas intestinalis TaxID=1653434 RepID=UPI0039A15D4D